MIFWCRRWMLHSRSNSATTSPWASANTWTSMWRGSVRYRSRNTVPSPKADCASRRAPASASASSSGPLHDPHPPAAAAGRRLDQQRPSEGGHRLRSGRLSPSTVTDGRVGYAGGPHQVLRADLRAHGVDGSGRRPDPDQSGAGRRPGRSRRTRRGTRTRVDRVGAGAAGGLDDQVVAQVGVRRRRCPAGARPGRPRPRGAHRRRRRSGPPSS